MHELLAMGVEFPDLGLVKIEADHTIPGFDNLLFQLEERHPSNWRIPASPEQYLEKIGWPTISVLL